MVPWSPAQGLVAGPLGPLLGLGVMMADPVKKAGQQRSENSGTYFPILSTLRIKSIPALPVPGQGGLLWTHRPLPQLQLVPLHFAPAATESNFS